MNHGTLFTLSAPSGAGKTSLVKALLAERDTLCVSVSHTTRPIRPGEVDGSDYHFVSRQEFQRLLEQQAFLESAEVFGNYYGTSRHWVEQQLFAGLDVILEIDWQGAMQIREQRPDTVSVFILPPSRETLKERLTKRGQDDGEVINQRLAQAREEMSHCGDADFLVVNEVFNTALDELLSIVDCAKLLHKQQQHRLKWLLEELLS